MTYAQLSDVKSYLGLSQIDQFDTKLQAILDGVNMDIETYTGEKETDARLKLAAMMWCEFIWENPETDDTIPPRVKAILDKYVDGKDDPGGITVELI